MVGGGGAAEVVGQGLTLMREVLEALGGLAEAFLALDGRGSPKLLMHVSTYKKKREEVNFSFKKRKKNNTNNTYLTTYQSEGGGLHEEQKLNQKTRRGRPTRRGQGARSSQTERRGTL